MTVAAGIRGCAPECADDAGDGERKDNRSTDDGEPPGAHSRHARVPVPLYENVNNAFLQASWFTARSRIVTRGAVAP